MAELLILGHQPEQLFGPVEREHAPAPRVGIEPARLGFDHPDGLGLGVEQVIH